MFGCAGKPERNAKWKRRIGPFRRTVINAWELAGHLSSSLGPSGGTWPRTTSVFTHWIWPQVNCWWGSSPVTAHTSLMVTHFVRPGVTGRDVHTLSSGWHHEHMDTPTLGHSLYLAVLMMLTLQQENFRFYLVDNFNLQLTSHSCLS